MRLMLGTVTLVTLALTAEAAAQDATPTPPPVTSQELGAALPPASGKQRFQFSRVGDSVLRLDSETGQMAICGPRAVGWACQAVPEDRAALESEIARLQTENAELTKRLASRLPQSSPPAGPVQPEMKLPSKAELERARVFLEQAWRRFVEMIEHLQKDLRDKG
ncbi:MAG: hypothetical protein JOZ70_04755 [Pseudolabrys sp.]|nr:hypothetical protein [Pseudolabrys sp.]MBV9954543.1 hypothetical protein [Pseudolabrys sp.]